MKELRPRVVKSTVQDFPGGPVFKTPCFHLEEGFDSWSEKFHMPHSMAKKKKKESPDKIDNKW